MVNHALTLACRNALNVVKDDLIVKVDELTRYVAIVTKISS